MIELEETPRDGVRQLVHDAVQALHHKHIAQSYNMPSLRNGINTRDVSSYVHGRTTPLATAAQARSTCIGTQWPAARLYQAGLRSSPVCTMCSMDEETLAHRHWFCEVC